MTAVERLRAAEARLRERAGALHPAEGWFLAGDIQRAIQKDDDLAEPEDGVGAFIAMMNPDIALAMAEVLRIESARVDDGASSITFDGSPMFPARPDILALAAAILGSAG